MAKARGTMSQARHSRVTRVRVSAHRVRICSVPAHPCVRCRGSCVAARSRWSNEGGGAQKGKRNYSVWGAKCARGDLNPRRIRPGKITAAQCMPNYKLTGIATSVRALSSTEGAAGCILNCMQEAANPRFRVPSLGEAPRRTAHTGLSSSSQQWRTAASVCSHLQCTLPNRFCLCCCLLPAAVLT